jgi:hypothetical protein
MEGFAPEQSIGSSNATLLSMSDKKRYVNYMGLHVDLGQAIPMAEREKRTREGRPMRRWLVCALAAVTVACWCALG